MDVSGWLPSACLRVGGGGSGLGACVGAIVREDLPLLDCLLAALCIVLKLAWAAAAWGVFGGSGRLVGEASKVQDGAVQQLQPTGAEPGRAAGPAVAAGVVGVPTSDPVPGETASTCGPKPADPCAPVAGRWRGRPSLAARPPKPMLAKAKPSHLALEEHGTTDVGSPRDKAHRPTVLGPTATRSSKGSSPPAPSAAVPQPGVIDALTVDCWAEDVAPPAPSAPPPNAMTCPDPTAPSDFIFATPPTPPRRTCGTPDLFAPALMSPPSSPDLSATGSPDPAPRPSQPEPTAEGAGAGPSRPDDACMLLNLVLEAIDTASNVLKPRPHPIRPVVAAAGAGPSAAAAPPPAVAAPVPSGFGPGADGGDAQRCCSYTELLHAFDSRFPQRHYAVLPGEGPGVGAGAGGNSSADSAAAGSRQDGGSSSGADGAAAETGDAVPEGLAVAQGRPSSLPGVALQGSGPSSSGPDVSAAAACQSKPQACHTPLSIGLGMSEPFVAGVDASHLLGSVAAHPPLAAPTAAYPTGHGFSHGLDSAMAADAAMFLAATRRASKDELPELHELGLLGTGALRLQPAMDDANGGAMAGGVAPGGIFGLPLIRTTPLPSRPSSRQDNSNNAPAAAQHVPAPGGVDGAAGTDGAGTPAHVARVPVNLRWSPSSVISHLPPVRTTTAPGRASAPPAVAGTSHAAAAAGGPIPAPFPSPPPAPRSSWSGGPGLALSMPGGVGRDGTPVSRGLSERLEAAAATGGGARRASWNGVCSYGATAGPIVVSGADRGPGHAALDAGSMAVAVPSMRPAHAAPQPGVVLASGGVWPGTCGPVAAPGPHQMAVTAPSGLCTPAPNPAQPWAAGGVAACYSVPVRAQPAPWAPYTPARVPLPRYPGAATSGAAVAAGAPMLGRQPDGSYMPAAGRRGAAASNGWLLRDRRPIHARYVDTFNPRPTISPRMRHPGAQQQPAAASPGLLPSPASPQKSGRVTLLMPVSPPRARPHEEHGGTGLDLPDASSYTNPMYDASPSQSVDSVSSGVAGSPQPQESLDTGLGTGPGEADEQQLAGAVAGVDGAAEGNAEGAYGVERAGSAHMLCFVEVV